MENLKIFFKEKVVGNIWFLSLVIAPFIVVFSFLISRLTVFENLELKIIDTRFNERPMDSTFKQTSSVVLIAVNDVAQEAIRPFPWPRDYHARIINNLNRAGAKVVGFDFVFDDIDRTGGDVAFREAAAKWQNVVVAGREPTNMTEGSQVEYTAVRKANYVTIFDGSPGTNVGNVNVRTDNDGVLRRYHPSSADVVGNQFISFGYLIAKLFYNSDDSLNSDGTSFTFAGKKIPSYDGESVFLNPYGPSHSFVEISADNILDDYEFNTKLELKAFYAALKENGIYEQLGIDSIKVAKSDSLQKLLMSNEEFRMLWATDVFDDTLSGVQQLVRGKVCIVGPMFPEAKDDFPTSMWTNGRSDQNRMYGVEMHAVAVQNLIDGKFLRTVNPLFILAVMVLVSFLSFGIIVSLKRLKITSQPVLIVMSYVAAFFAFGGVVLLVLIIGEVNPIAYIASREVLTKSFIIGGVFLGSALVTFILYRIKSLQEFSVEVFSLTIAIGGYLIADAYAQYIFEKNRVILSIVPFTATLVFAYGSSILYQYFTESRQKKMIKGFFNVYVTPALVDQMIANPDSFKLGGERRELTMFFSDIKGFTNISEGYKNEPEKLVELLNEYLGTMTDIVFKYGGTLDKYIGDAVVAFWNAPVSVENHAKQACWAAIEMQETLTALRLKWKAEGKPEIFSRMGINTAQVIVGNMGSSSRFAYTAMGDGMNLAARLEAANKAFKTSIMISQYTYEQVKDYCLCRELATITVQGKEEPIKVYELVAKKEPGKVYEELAPAETALKGVMAIAKE
ncbi:MAG: adenylate/guanylate cyclase domain-containing protein [Chloroherpetonaceae bacterium]|nr:adenylate/guanylate cyclase domain-containing protein [Chloroherpetonaceae bacterium]